jgi:hypothetical protein
MKKGTVFGPQIKQPFEDHARLNSTKIRAWKPFENDCRNFLDNEEGSIRIFKKLKRGTVQNGVKICWLATAGVITETPTAEHKTQKKTK